ARLRPAPDSQVLQRISPTARRRPSHPPSNALGSSPGPPFSTPAICCAAMSQTCVGFVPKRVFLQQHPANRARALQADNGALSGQGRQKWSFAGWSFNPLEGSLFAPDGRSVDLTRQETRLLTLFLQAGGRTLTRDFLLDSLGEPDRPVYDRAVDKVVNRLRQKLGDDGRQPRFILTQHGFGYSFAERARASLDVAPAQDPEAQPVDRLTISVWPFRNLTGETPFDYLAAGLTD